MNGECSQEYCDVCGYGNESDQIKLCLTCCEMEDILNGDMGLVAEVYDVLKYGPRRQYEEMFKNVGKPITAYEITP